jgi:hypothetical protein
MGVHSGGMGGFKFSEARAIKQRELSVRFGASLVS